MLAVHRKSSGIVVAAEFSSSWQPADCAPPRASLGSVAIITYIPTAAGFLYLAVVLDAFSRRIVGWAMETHLRTELVSVALEMAIGQRKPSNVIHHSDQGSQGGINWSSQHNREECCDGRETAVGSSVTGQVEVARAAGDGAT